MAFKPLTVSTPSEEQAHILAEDDAALYESLIGEDCVMKIGEQMAYKTISNNTVRIMDGIVVVGGHVGRIVKGDYEDMTIDNGTSGQSRNDLIVARFKSGGTGGADSYSLVVVKGTPGSTGKDPTVVKDDLYAGGKQRDYPLYRVRLENLSVVGVDKLFKVQNRLMDIVNIIYPIGSIYMSANNVNPEKLFGGQWEIFGQGKTLIGKASEGTFGTLGATGGETSKNVNVAGHSHDITHTHGINSHDHTISHTHTVNSHTHAIGHTHNVPDHTHAIGNTTLTYTQTASHGHSFTRPNGSAPTLGVTSASGDQNNGYLSNVWNGGGDVRINNAGGNGAHNHSCSTFTGLKTGGASSGSSGAATPGTNGPSNGRSGGSGAMATNGASRSSSGTAGEQTITVDVTQPYIVVNMWKRIA